LSALAPVAARRASSPGADTVADMADDHWQMAAPQATLQITTGVTGPAAAVGHRLTIVMTSWRATVQWTGDEPASVDLTADVDSLEVRGGSGGVKGLSGPEKAIARSNALKTLDAARYPMIAFRADDVARTETGYRLTGALEIHGITRDHVVDLAVDDRGGSWHLSCDSVVRQTEFGVKPYSLMMGALKVADEVTVSLRGERAKD
jgi:polyisoprenoid-binding protein YceI